VSVDKLKAQLAKFHKLDVKNTGRISYADFVQALALSPESVFSKHLFFLLDENGTGSIDFREFLLGLGMLDAQSNPQVFCVRVYIWNVLNLTT
jgi:Ca2+-binding EF-hand superfamily protein